MKKIIKFILLRLLFYLQKPFLKYKKHLLTLYSYHNLKNTYDNLFLNGEIIITDESNFFVENNIHIGNNAFFRTEGGLYIGANTHISRNVTIYTTNHNYNGDRLPYDESLIKKSVKIGKNVWIGMNVCILPGVSIGDGAIIGMGTIVYNDVKELSIIGQSGMKYLKKRDSNHYNEQEKKCSYGYVGGRKI